ncbi:MAG: General stress protein 30 [Firmicutes bacterium ADurb.Bin262]|nr:MAG: General stress protein 30 [Firmicutes bacterium ADurb.Bin262]
MIKGVLKKNKFVYRQLCRCYDIYLFHTGRLKFKKAMRGRIREIKKAPRKILLCGVPNHTNLGDQAQVFCELKWFRQNYPGHEVFCFCSADLMKYHGALIKMLKKSLKKADLVFMQSGYNTTDIYLSEEQMHRAAVVNFKKNKIVFMPQTVFFHDEREQDISARTYAKHKHIIFLARDSLSCDKAKAMFPQHRVELYPDIVTTLIGGMQFDAERSGILLCVRNDKESIFDQQQIKGMMSRLEKYGDVDLTDTSADVPVDELAENREKYILSAVRRFARYQVTVTDRYHGLIFSLVAGTPVVVLPTSDHKLSSGVDWFSGISEFKPYVRYCGDIEEVGQLVGDVLKADLDHQLPDTFNRYYGKLKPLVEGDAK